MSEKYVPPWIAERLNVLLAPEDSPGALPGWCQLSKGEFIAREILHDRLVRAVEIGVYGGRSLLPAAMAMKELGTGFVVGIDPYTYERQVEGMEAYPNHMEFGRILKYEKTYFGTLEAIKKEGLSEQCGIIRTSAHLCPDLFGELDYLHIDGCHSDLSSYRDVTMWAPKVRRGGLIVLDDAFWEQLQYARSILANTCEPPFVHQDGWEVYRKL